MDYEQAERAKEMLAKLSIEEEIKEVEIDGDFKADSEDEDEANKNHEDDLPLDFTIVNVADAEDAEDPEEELENLIPDKRNTIELSNIPEEEGDELDASFEIVHYHDIYLLPDGEYNYSKSGKEYEARAC
mmetsp:Transcript_16191/g.17976  ORF Transcript_16191/g.17976 Transcript_16191/m.17976 type:complete len:130 (+) Transcript_16191:342-731(+)